MYFTTGIKITLIYKFKLNIVVLIYLGNIYSPIFNRLLLIEK